MQPSSRSNFARIAMIIDCFDEVNTPRKSAEIIDLLETSRATGFGLIRALVKSGWLERVDHGIVRLGHKATQLIHIPLEIDQALKDTSQFMKISGTVRTDRQPDRSTANEWRPELIRLVDTTSYKRPGPYRIAFANASLGNPWRKAMLASMRYAERLHGDLIARFDVSDAGDDAKTQLAQVNQFIEDGIDLLIVSQTRFDDKELSDRLSEIADTGLPIIAVDRRPDVPDALVSFVTASDRRIGWVSAMWMAERLNGQGRVWMLSGLEGASPAIRRQSAALAGFANFPGIKIEAVNYTSWTEEGGYNAVDRLLADGAEIPDGVWCDSGLQGIGSLRRFLEEGKALPAHTGGDVNQMYKLALHHKLPFVAVDYPAAMGARAIDIAIDILSGNRVASRLEVPVQVVLPRGSETPSVAADIWAETHVRWELPDNTILSQGPSLRTRAAQIEADNP